MIFPEFYGADINYLNSLREFLILKCEVEAGEDRKTELLKASEFLIQKPVCFDPFSTDNAPMESERQLMEMLATMEDNGASQPEKMSEFAFYSRIRYLKKKFSAKEGG